MAAEDILQDIGAISMISSDSQVMGRVAEVISRTWRTERCEARADAELLDIAPNNILRNCTIYFDVGGAGFFLFCILYVYFCIVLLNEPRMFKNWLLLNDEHSKRLLDLLVHAFCLSLGIDVT